MISHRFLSLAEEEIAQSALYYDEIARELGADFLNDIQMAIDRLRDYPKLGAPLSVRLRSILLARFPFSLIYYSEPNSIVIVAVAHHSRRPGYWKNRIK